MLTKITRFAALLDNHLLSPIVGRPSTSQFWYLPEPARVRDQETLDAYFSAEHGTPFYPIDLRAKRNYRFKNNDGIIYLDYKGTTGQRINPEAAFLYALGVHDAYLSTGEKSLKQEFLDYADYFLARQTVEGDWPYDFKWHSMPVGWTSGLAQGHGASVMLRAWMLVGEEKYRRAASSAVSRFGVPISEGGYLALFDPAQVAYYEEHPAFPRTAIYGYMYTLIGLFELAHWAGDSAARQLWSQGISSLEQMLPYFSTGRWTLYDLEYTGSRPNYHSPRYHRVATDCLLAVALLAESDVLKKHYRSWKEMDTLPRRVEAYMRKAVFKITCR